MERRTTRITGALGALTAGIIVSTSLVSAPAAQAAESDATVTQANATGVVIARDQSVPLTAVPMAPRAVTVTTSPNTRVTLKAPRTKTRSAKTNDKGIATFTKLKAGKKYTVTADGETATVVPVLKVGRARDLTIMTTSEPGTITATWAHATSKARGGLTIGYTLTATPVGVADGVPDGDPDVPSISIKTESTEAVLRGLDPTVLYSFTVTPHNLLGEGRASVARMDRSLAEVSGIAMPAADDAGSDSAEEAPSAEPSAAPVATSPPASRPAPNPAPQMRTVWVCPDEFTEVDGVCTQNRAYTFHTETETTAYTYHDEFVETNRIWHDHAFNPHNGCAYTVHGDRCMGWEIQGYTTKFKDDAPSGWTDNGTAYARDVDVKDATPDGWSDNGTEWIRTAAKVARTVPA
ncbi:MAG: fibronectin type III domain-containing protein [Gammaproteobacteria bacterium]|nr:fibronectin type III domain-containing protein [Gammaproteobacteria bacterium]